MKHKRGSLKILIEEILRTDRPDTVEDLTRLVQKRRKDVSSERVVSIVESLKEEGRIELGVLLPWAETFFDYLKLWPENRSFYLVVMATFATILAIRVLPDTYPLVVFRWVVGAVFVLYLPGYTVIQALFPAEGELDDIVRFALSIGLSLGVTPLIGLLLNYTPWGIRLDPIVVSLSLFVMVLSLLGAYRKYKRLKWG